MDRPTCQSCVYWDANEDGESGWCNRHAPIAAVMPGPTYEGEHYRSNATTLWPETQYDDWCGEHPAFPAYIASLKDDRKDDRAADPPANPRTQGAKGMNERYVTGPENPAKPGGLYPPFAAPSR